MTAWSVAGRQRRRLGSPQGSVTLGAMESKLAKAAEWALVEATQRLSPEERLNAFLVHCRLVTELCESSRKIRVHIPHPCRRYTGRVETGPAGTQCQRACRSGECARST
jgi:hypothetical protein